MLRCIHGNLVHCTCSHNCPARTSKKWTNRLVCPTAHQCSGQPRCASCTCACGRWPRKPCGATEHRVHLRPKHGALFFFLSVANNSHGAPKNCHPCAMWNTRGAAHLGFPSPCRTCQVRAVDRQNRGMPLSRSGPAGCECGDHRGCLSSFPS